jgi:hypothetical protein
MARGGLFAIYVDGFLFLFRDGVMVTLGTHEHVNRHSEQAYNLLLELFRS